MKRGLLIGSLLLTLISVSLAAESAITRKIFGRMDVPPGYEMVIGSAELPAGTSIGRHYHHGVEFGYVAAGEMDLEVAGEKTIRLKAGDFYKIDAGKVHDARSINGAAKAIATWIVEKGKPLAEPAK